MIFKNFLASIALLICFFPQVLIAQSNTEDVIYLKDGGILRGEIIERTGQILKIKTAGRNVFAIDQTEIKKVTVEEMTNAGAWNRLGYFNNTGFSLLPGSNDVTVRFEMVNGYQFSPFLSAGIGVGLTLYQDPVSLVPVFIDVKYKLIDAKATPFLSVKSGYSFSVLADDERQLQDHKGGFMFNPAIGAEFELNDQLGFYLSAGYNLDNTTIEQTGWIDQLTTTEINYRRVQLGFGLSF